MRVLNRLSAAEAFSVFANDVELLSDRKAAARRLAALLSSAPESRERGVIRTAVIKCGLAARYAQLHREVDDRFCEVSKLLGRNGPETLARVDGLYGACVYE